MKKIIIAGTSQFSSVMHKLVNVENEDEVIAFTINREYIQSDTFEGKPVVAFEELSETFDMTRYDIMLTFGYTLLNAIREKFYKECKDKGYNIYTFISKNSCVYTDSIGEGTLVLPSVYIGPFNEIGKCNIIWNGTNISHHSIIGNFNNIAAGAILAGDVIIGNNCFLGVNTSYKNGVKVASQSFIAASSYVSKNTKENTAYSGSPARSIKGITALELINLV